MPTITITSDTPKQDPASVALAATQRMIKGIGPWAFARFCRNNGVKLEQCYTLMFGKPPRLL